MARMSFSVLIMVILALLVLNAAGPTSAMWSGGGSVGKLLKDVVEAEGQQEASGHETLIIREEVIELETNDNNNNKEEADVIMMGRKGQVMKCIPMGKYCVSSRDCCPPGRCNFGPPVPICSL